MILLLDIGNSSVKWALQQDDVLTSRGAFSYTKNSFEQDLWENLSFSKKPSNVLVSNVAGDDIFSSLDDWVKLQWQQECWQPKVSAKFKELKNSYTNIQQMGLDRWLAMIASWEKYQSALCLVSCGTALTIDLINADGQHLGGYIVPGIELMQKALIDNTKQIDVSVKHQASLVYAKDTQTAVSNGAFLATVSTVDHVVENFSNETNDEVKCIITGGMAEIIKPLLAASFKHEANLVLDGLSTLYKAC